MFELFLLPTVTIEWLLLFTIKQYLDVILPDYINKLQLNAVNEMNSKLIHSRVKPKVGIHVLYSKEQMFTKTDYNKRNKIDHEFI